MKRFLIITVLATRTENGYEIVRPLTAWGVFSSDEQAKTYMIQQAWKMTPSKDGWTVREPIVDEVSPDFIVAADNELGAQ